MVSSVSSAVDTVEAEVRELVRRRGLDPVQDRLAMRRLIDEVVHDDERALASTMPVLPDPRRAARAVCDAVAGFGPLQRHLDDPDVEEIWTKERLPQGSIGAKRWWRLAEASRVRHCNRCQDGAVWPAGLSEDAGEGTPTCALAPSTTRS